MPLFFGFDYVPDSRTTFNFPFKGALRLLAMKRNLLISVYDNENSPQTAKDSLGIILHQVGSQPARAFHWDYFVSYILFWTCLHALTQTKGRSSNRQLTSRHLWILCLHLILRIFLNLHCQSKMKSTALPLTWTT